MDKQANILVTGATGLVGTYLLHHLVKEGYTNISALTRKGSDMTLLDDILPKIQCVEGDILYLDTLEDALENIEYVFHCAAMVSYDSRDRDILMKTNVEGTANVVNLCLDKNIKKLLHVSSIAAIGREKNQTLITEKSKWTNDEVRSQYALSKYLAEQEVWRGAAEGLSVAIINPSIILGSGHWNSSSTALFKQVWDGLRFYPLGTTGFVDVRDVVRFMTILMESNLENERFIVSAGNFSFQYIFDLMAKSMGKNPPSIKVTSLIRALAWRIEWLRSMLTGKRVLITKETAEVSSSTYYFDNQKSFNFFSFYYIPLEKTIVETSDLLKKSAQNEFKAVLLPLT